MSRVYVPIDLPDGAIIRDVYIETAAKHYRVAQIVGPIIHAADETAKPAVHHFRLQSSDRWEYELVSLTSDQASLAERAGVLHHMGASGWENYQVTPGVLWFKRRLAP